VHFYNCLRQNSRFWQLRLQKTQTKTKTDLRRHVLVHDERCVARARRTCERASSPARHDARDTVERRTSDCPPYAACWRSKNATVNNFSPYRIETKPNLSQQCRVSRTVDSLGVSASICSSCATGSKRYSAQYDGISVSNIFVRCCLIESQSSIVPPTFASHGAARCCHQYRQHYCAARVEDVVHRHQTSSSHYCRLQLSMRSRPRSGARRTRRSSRSSPASSRRSRRRRSASRMLCSVRLTTRNAFVMFDDHTVSGRKSSCCVFDRYRFRCRF
jgi:hypothetical protein